MGAAPLCSVPFSSSVATLSLPPRVRVAPLATRVALASGSTLAPLVARVPANTAVAPVWLLAPPNVKVPVPALFRPPVPLMTPSKMLLPPLPVVSVKLFKTTLPAPASVPRAWSPPRASVEPVATVVAEVALKAAVLASVSVPLATFNAPTLAAPARRLLPLLLSVVAPTSAMALPPFRPMVMALRRPLPSSVPASARLPMLSSPFRRSVAPLATPTCAVSARRPAETRLSVPPLTCTVPAFAAPARVVLPLLASVPVPRSALTAAPVSV